MTATGEASWLLFSEDARAGVDGARLVQAARELELQELEKDIALESALALLAVAQARAFEAIERENLSLTYADLAAAESRRAAGTGSRADVARLRARISRDRQALVAAYEARRGAEIRFNRLLDRPLDQQILPVIDEAESAARQANDPAETLPLPLEATVRTPAAFDGLGAKLLTLAEAQAPEIAAAQRLLEAREREVLAARRAFYLPTAFASASLATRLAEGGVGREPPTPPGAEGLFPLPPDTSWSLGVGVELPILTGGARAARRARAELDRDATELLLDRARQQVEERLRLALLGLETAYETRLQAQRAAQAAEEAFEVVEDAYAQGLENLTTLLDAQRELRVARRSQAAATYAALARWHEVERATGGELDDAALSRIQSRLQEHDSNPPEKTP
ncbi:MAG: TolC family protein, partial [Acidobacteriota bacterium]